MRHQGLLPGRRFQDIVVSKKDLAEMYIQTNRKHGNSGNSVQKTEVKCSGRHHTGYKS